MDQLLTPLQNFKTMTCLLDDYYNKTLSDDLGSLLSDMQLFEDGSGTWDPATWNDWMDALENKQLVTAIEGFKAMFNFLNAYYERTSSASEDIKIILDSMQVDKTGEPIDSIVWHLWIECVQKNI